MSNSSSSLWFVVRLARGAVYRHCNAVSHALATAASTATRIRTIELLVYMSACLSIGSMTSLSL